MNSSVGMSKKKQAFKRELVLALDLEQVCLCSVEALETAVFSGKTYIQMLFVSSHVSSSEFFPLSEKNIFCFKKVYY